MIQVMSGDTLSVRGSLDISSGTLVAKNGQFPRALLAQQDLAERGVSLAGLQIWDNVGNSLPSAAADDDLGFVSGTYGTDAITIQSGNAASGSVTQYGRFFVDVDDSFVLGETMSMRVRSGMITTVADTSATVDLQVYVGDGDGAVGSDLCTTAAQSMNSLTKANYDFTINAESLVNGDVLDCRVAVAITDSATATDVIGEISAIKFRRDIKG